MSSLRVVGAPRPIQRSLVTALELTGLGQDLVSMVRIVLVKEPHAFIKRCCLARSTH